MKINICQIKPPNYVHANSLDDLSGLLFHSINETKYKCIHNHNRLFKDHINIIIGSHLLKEKEIELLAKYNLIIVNTEQLKDCPGEWLRSISSASKNTIVWDYSWENINYIKQINPNITCEFLKLGYNKNMERINFRSSINKENDILFYGSMNERRFNIIKGLEDKGIKVKCIYGVYGKELDELITNSKYILNIHFYECKILESVRLFYLITNKIPIISEFSSDSKDDQNMSEFIEKSSYNDIINKIIYILKQEYKLYLEKADNNFKKFKKLKQSDIMNGLLNRVASNSMLQT